MLDKDKIIEDIYAKKLEIAISIFLAFNNGEFDNKNFDFLSHIIKSIEESKIIVLNDSLKLENVYEKEVKELLNKISFCLGYDVDSIFYNKSPIIADSFVNSMKFELDKSKVYFSYLSGLKMFIKLGISYEEFLSRYERGEDVFKLAKLVKMLQKKANFYDSKRSISDIKNMIKVDNNTAKMGDIIEDYHISSMDDIMKLYVEISLALMDEYNLDEEGKEVIKKSKDKLKERYGVSLNKIQLRNLKRNLDEFYDMDLFNSLVHSSNIGESLNKHNLTLSRDLFNAVVHLYSTVLTNRPFNSHKMIEGKQYNFVVFPSSLLKTTESNMDLVVLHELIHAIEPKENYKKSLIYKSRAMNEALTQYLSYISYYHYKKNTLDYETIVNNMKQDRCSYNCMFPLVEMLKNSILWDNILNMKIKNDYTILETQIGTDSEKIFDVFNNVYDQKEKQKLSSVLFKEYEAKLKEIIKKIENDVNRCNKNY